MNLSRIAAETLQMSWSHKAERGERERQSEGEEYTETALPEKSLNNSGQNYDWQQ